MPEFGEDLLRWQTETVRIFRAEDDAEGIVGQDDQLRTPVEGHRLRTGQADAQGRDQALRPEGQRSERGSRPIETADVRPELATIGQQIIDHQIVDGIAFRGGARHHQGSPAPCRSVGITPLAPEAKMQPPSCGPTVVSIGSHCPDRWPAQETGDACIGNILTYWRARSRLDAEKLMASMIDDFCMTCVADSLGL